MRQTSSKKKATGPKKASKKKATGTKKAPPLHEQAKATLEKMQAKDPGLKGLLEKAYGYVVFPSVGKAAAVVGGAFGRGVVFERDKPIGYATIGQLTIGVQIGGDTFSELIVFDSRESLERFKRDRMAFAANASAVMVKAGAAASSNFGKGAAVFVHSDGGMMLELALGGQKFKFKPIGENGSQAGPSANGNGPTSSRSSGSDEGEGEEASTSLGVTGFVREHPVWAFLVGTGLATGAVFAASKFLKSSWLDQSDDQDEEEDDTESDGAEEDEDEGQARYRQDDDEEEEDEDNNRKTRGRAAAEDEGEEDESDEEQDDQGDDDEAVAEDDDEGEEEGGRGNGRTSARKLWRSRR